MPSNLDSGVDVWYNKQEGSTEMNIEAVVKLLVALAISLEVSPEELAEIFNDDDACQEYFDTVVRIQNGT